MAARPRTADDLLRQVEQHHEQYLRSLKSLHEVVFAANRGGPAGGTRMERTGSNETAPHSPVQPALFAAPPSPLPRPFHTNTSLSESALVGPVAKRPRRNTLDLPERHGSMGTLGAPDRKHIPASLYEADSDEDVDFIPLLPPPTQAPRAPEERVPSVQHPLASHAHSVDDLVRHIRALDGGAGDDGSDRERATGEPPVQNPVAVALDPVWGKRREVDAASVLNTQTYDSPDHDVLYANATYMVYDVGRDGLAVQQHDGRHNDDGETLDATTVWETLKDVNPSGHAVGRMTILQEPSPLMLAVAHTTMSKHFDMNELYQHLIGTQDNKGKTKAYMNRAFEASPLRRRTFFFVFKYYTAVTEGLAPAPWQQFDQRAPDKRHQDHIDIAECSSVLALSLESQPVNEMQLRRLKKKRPVSNNNGRGGEQGGAAKDAAVQVGHVADAFAPWHLLSLQSFPDDRHSMRSEDVGKPFYSGPYAFLDTLAAEYRDAVKRYAELHDMIAKLITPPNQFMFDVRLRDKLLFEDKNFTYSRRYFWAYNTLGVINDGVKAMMAAYTSTFTPDFWAGRHPTLWPLRGDAAENAGYLARMAALRHELERAVEDLGRAVERNERTRKEIANLREQLFSGSSVRESRRAVEQGDNIKILTLVSMIFLPLTFVTSVFGITELTIAPSDWRFPVVMVCVCVPFFAIITVLQTRAGMNAVRKVGNAVESYFNPGRVRLLREKKVQALTAKVVEEKKQQRRRTRFGRGKGARSLGASDGTLAFADGGKRGVGLGISGFAKGGAFWRWRRVRVGQAFTEKADGEGVV